MELRAITKLLETTRIHFGLPLQATRLPAAGSTRRTNAGKRSHRHAAAREPASVGWRSAP